eukprot:TRINITY_DN32806_c0_g1_i1.p1 TRINITY_DN32806_c0_g1~~TRINITY_DN32806_c0_g1_i1.p1  ORF type:complete len:247 (+),score=75.89 TRINITY_DN32806_c0_g1_i1:109-849(+)
MCIRDRGDEEVHTATTTTIVRQFEEERDDSTADAFEATVEVEDADDEVEVEVEVPRRRVFLPRSPSRKGMSKRWRSNDSFFEDDVLDDGGSMGYVRSSTQEWCGDVAGNGMMLTTTTTTTTAYQMEERGDTTSDDEDEYDDGAISEMSEMMERCLSISSSDDRLHSTSSTTTSSGRRVIRGVTLSSSPNPDMGITGTLTSTSPPALGSSATAVSYTHLRAHETPEHLVCRLLLEKKKITSHNTYLM